MANINTPAHDFAPPWLKIPTYDSNKPSGADRGGHASRKESHSYNSTRQAKDNDNFNSSRQFCNDSRANRNNYDDSNYDVNAGQNSYSNNCNGTSSNLQSAILRRPHSRHDFRNGPSYSKGDIYNRHLTNNGGNYYNKSKGKCADLSTTNNTNSLFEDNGGINASSNNFNQEFPSLQGDINEEQASSPPAVNGSVWEKHRSIAGHSRVGAGKKIQLIKKPFNSDVNNESNRKSLTGVSLPSSSSVLNSSSTSAVTNPHTVIVAPVAKGSSGIYRALVPAKQSNGKKIMAVKDSPSSKTQLTAKKVPITNSSASSNHPMEILVKHPKAPGNKSEFLKALRNESKDADNARKDGQSGDTLGEFGGSSCGKNKTEKLVPNGIDIAKMTVNDDGGKPLLSSSLEAEQRLLREMGWKEDDDDDNFAPLTEDEMREFRTLSEQIAKKNGMRRNLQANFSPRRLAPYPLTLPADTCSSSSESDSDF